MSGSENVGIALALVFGAGASTAIGASVVFFPTLVKMTSRRVLASALGFSAGVMSYVSFVEIFAKSSDSFEDAGFDESKAYLYATLCFFGGVIAMLLLNRVVTTLLGGHHHEHHHHHHHHHHHQQQHQERNATAPAASNDNDNDNVDSHSRQRQSETTNVGTDSKESIGACACCSNDPVGELEQIRKMAEEIERRNCNDTNPDDEDDNDGGRISSEEEQQEQGEETTKKDTDGDQRLVRMGVNTALAIALHNFPEGLATFVAALDDPTVGAILAFAIAIHNIPEGLCVALPIYYATGKRLNAFLWALLSGASEFIAALLGWAVLANSFSDSLYAVLFGLVGGMMVIISVRELLPTAHFYDPEDTVVTNSFIAGMGLMAVSLIMFVV